MSFRTVVVTLQMTYEDDIILDGGYTIADPVDWNWQRIIRNTVEGVHYTTVLEAEEIEF